MEWKKAAQAAREWAGNTSPKMPYQAVKDGKLKDARIGRGRN